MRHLFLLGQGCVSEERERAIDAAIAHLDAEIVPFRDPGTGEERYWFQGPNLGPSFNAQLGADVVEALEEAGLWPVVEDEDENEYDWWDWS